MIFRKETFQLSNSLRDLRQRQIADRLVLRKLSLDRWLGMFYVIAVAFGFAPKVEFNTFRVIRGSVFWPQKYDPRNARNTRNNTNVLLFDF